MAQAKQASKRKRKSKAVSVLGAAGLLSLAGSASAQTVGLSHAADIPTRNTQPGHQITLSEEEVSDVSLATFYVFDKENAGALRPGVQLVRGGGCGCGGGGCRGCGGGCGGRGCGCFAGCGGCGGCGIGLGLLGLGLGLYGGCGGCYYSGYNYGGYYGAYGGCYYGRPYGGCYSY